MFTLRSCLSITPMWKRVFSSNALLENFKGQLYIPFNGFLGGIELIVVNEDV